MHLIKYQRFNRISRILFPLFFTFLCNFSHAQTKVHQYDYDLAGNRIARNIIFIRAASPTSPLANQELAQPNIDSASAVSEKITENLAIDLFPNPTLKTVQVQFSNAEVHINEVRLIDQTGKMLSQRKDMVGDLKFDLEAYPLGTYFIWLLLDEKVHRFKVIKQ